MDDLADNRMTATQVLGIDAPLREPTDSRLQEFIPFAYVAAGFGAFFATLYVPEWYWVMPYYFLGGVAAVHAIASLAAKKR